MINTLFTIGYSNRSIDDLIALLRQHKIIALCDVRSAPYSSRNPQFNREPLKKVLKSHNTEYVFLGDELGARPKDQSCYVDGKAIYPVRESWRILIDGSLILIHPVRPRHIRPMIGPDLVL